VIGVRRPERSRLLLLKRLAVDFENFDRATGRVIKDADCKPTVIGPKTHTVSDGPPNLPDVGVSIQ